MDAASLTVAPGEHTLVLDAAMEGDEGAHLKVELRIWGEAEVVPRR